MNLNFNKIKQYILCFPILIAGSIAILTSCENDPETVKRITFESELPKVKINDMHTEITDSGYLRIEIDAPVMQSFESDDEKESVYDEYPEGINVKLYNRDTIESVITAEYAIYYKDKNLWEAKRNVEAKNIIKNEKLNTEHLFWDIKEEKIFTDKFVRITTENEVYIGTGFESDQDFTSWSIKNPKGSFVINEEE